MNRVMVAVVMAGLLVGAACAEDEPKGPWERSAALGLSVTTGNSDSMMTVGSLNAHGVWPEDDWLLGLDAAYGKSDGDKSAERYHGAAQYKHLLDERWYVTGVADALHDGIADVSYRLAIGPGLGYYFIRSERTTFTVDGGPSYVVEKYSGDGEGTADPAERSHDYIALRFGDRFEHKFNETAKIWQATEYLPQVDDFENYRLNTEIGVESAMTKSLSLRVVGRHEYNNQPADGRRHYDLSLISSIAYKF